MCVMFMVSYLDFSEVHFLVDTGLCVKYVLKSAICFFEWALIQSNFLSYPVGVQKYKKSQV